MATKFTSVDDYLASFDGVTRTRLDEFRTIVREVLPTATETLHYNIPAYNIDGKWPAYFSGYAKHISLALGGPIGHIVEKFADELAPYKSSFSAIQFPHDKPLPKELIQKLISYRAEEFGVCDPGYTFNNVI